MESMTDRADEALRAAYTVAIYRADIEPEPVYLRIGERNSALDRWLAARDARHFAFVSAANPGSVALSDSENLQRHERLLARLREEDLAFENGESYEAASGGWREASLLVCDLERAAAVALARDFGQAALLVGEAGGAVELVFTTAAQEKG